MLNEMVKILISSAGALGSLASVASTCPHYHIIVIVKLCGTSLYKMEHRGERGSKGAVRGAERCCLSVLSIQKYTVPYVRTQSGSARP
jgi:hypothetical protein